MSTINQLIKKNRKTAPRKPKAVALMRGFNTLKIDQQNFVHLSREVFV
jgi:hypothetical protein